jgi:hypothetical protein
MSWGVEAKGDREAIGKKFDAYLETAKGWQMPPGEIEDIERVKKQAQESADAVGVPVEIRAGGSWNLRWGNPDGITRHSFSECYLRVTALSALAQAVPEPAGEVPAAIGG